MLLGMDLQQIFLFPLKDAEARKHFLIGCLVSLAAFIIPVLPFLALYGYAARIAKQVLNDETPHMVAWDDWEGMLKDGARMFGVRMVYMLPLLILLIPVFIGSIGMPILLENTNGSNVDTVMALFMLVMFGSLCVFIPLSFPLAVIVPAAEMYAVEKSEFAAGFRVKEWWAIFRANIGGFIAAFGIYYAASMILMLALQIIMITIILACLLPILMPAITMYISLIMYVTIAQAHKTGKQKLLEKEAALQQA